MALFRRRRRVDLGRYEEPEPVAPAPLDRVLEEGVLIAASAVRMAIKNVIIVGALREHRDFDASALAEEAREELTMLAARNVDSAARLDEKHSADAAAHGVDDDAEEHGNRARVYRALAGALRTAAADPERLAAIVVEARDDAWSEIGTAIEAKLDRVEDDPSQDPGYEKNRASRIRALVQVDLMLLEQNADDYGAF